MLPTRREDLARAVGRLAPSGWGAADREVRATCLDGKVVEGIFRSAADQHLVVETWGEELAYVATEEIKTLEIGVRRAGRELIIVSALIVAITALLVVEWNIPFLREHVRLSWLGGQLAIFGFVGLRVLRRRTPLGSWLRKWQEVFNVDRPAGTRGSL